VDERTKNDFLSPIDRPLPSIYYVREADGTIRNATSIEEFGESLGKMDTRRIARTEVAEGVEVSTVFLGLDHNFGFDGAPVLFETLVFGCPLDGEMDRYTTESAARAGHEAMVERVLESLEAGRGKS